MKGIIHHLYGNVPSGPPHSRDGLIVAWIHIFERRHRLIFLFFFLLILSVLGAYVVIRLRFSILPESSVAYHARQADLSKWFFARAEFMLAKRFRASQFPADFIDANGRERADWLRNWILSEVRKK